MAWAAEMAPNALHTSVCYHSVSGQTPAVPLPIGCTLQRCCHSGQGSPSDIQAHICDDGAVVTAQVPKSIADRAPDGYAHWNQTKGDVRFAAPPLLAPAMALQEALDVQDRVLDHELRAVRPACRPS